MVEEEQCCETCEHEGESVGESACVGCDCGPFSQWAPKTATLLAAKDAEIKRLKVDAEKAELVARANAIEFQSVLNRAEEAEAQVEALGPVIALARNCALAYTEAADPGLSTEDIIVVWERELKALAEGLRSMDDSTC